MQIKSNWMIAVITGFWQTCLFFYQSLVLPGIWLSQAPAQAIHRSLWKQRSFVCQMSSLCFAGMMLIVYNTYILTAVAHFFQLIISCVVLFLCWLRSMRSCLGAHFGHFCCCSIQAGRVFFFNSRPCENCLTRSGSLFFNPGLASYFLHSLKKCIYLCIHIFLFSPVVYFYFLLGGVSKLKMYMGLNKQNSSFLIYIISILMATSVCWLFIFF